MLKKTRNLFILESKSSVLTNSVLSELDFNGLVVLRYPTTPTKINSIFKNNKSIACSVSFTSLYLGDWDYIIIHVVETIIDKTEDDTIVLEFGNIAHQFNQIALKHNCDIGEHISNCFKIEGTPEKEDCYYCNFLKTLPRKRTRKIIYETEDFFVYSTIGQFISGYLLIIPKKHIMSLAQLSPELRRKFLEVLKDVKQILKLTYNCSNILVWENGTSNLEKEEAKDSVVHAHVHVVPSNLTATKIQQISGIAFTRIQFDQLSKYFNSSYLLIQDTFNSCWCINNNPHTYIPRQYIRQLLADEYKIEGDDLWNWHLHPFYEKMKETDDTIVKAIHDNYSSLSERIKLNTN